MKIRSLSLSVIAAMQLAAASADAQEHVSHGRFADVALYHPAAGDTFEMIKLNGGRMIPLSRSIGIASDGAIPRALIATIWLGVIDSSASLPASSS